MAYFTQVPAKNKQGYKWRCVKDGPTDPVTGKRKQIARTAEKKKDAEKLVDDALREITEHGLINASKAAKITFDQFAKDWLETYATGVKISTVRIREKEIKVLNRYIAKVQLTKITGKMYQNILNDLHKQEYARSTIEGVHVTANMIFKQAIAWQMIKFNPCAHAKVPKKQVTVDEIESITIEDKYLEKKELEEFLDKVKEIGLKSDITIFYTLALTGMRVGELCALKWTDIDFDNQKISVTKTLYNPGNNMKDYTLLPPKTSGSIRSFDIDDTVINVLKKHRLKQKETRMQQIDYHSENFIFAHDNGYPFIAKNINIRVARIKKNTSIKKRVTPHTFRHTHVSLLTEAGVDLKTIMDRVGHSDMRTTMEIYTHVTEKMKKDASEKMKNHLGNILNL